MKKDTFFYDPEEQVYVANVNGKEYITKDKRHFEPRPLTVSSGIFDLYIYTAIHYLLRRGFLRSNLDWRTYQGKFYLRIQDPDTDYEDPYDGENALHGGTELAQLVVSVRREDDTIVVENNIGYIGYEFDSGEKSNEFKIQPFSEFDDCDQFLTFWDDYMRDLKSRHNQIGDLE